MTTQPYAIPAGTELSTCRSCQCPIYWVILPSGKRMPIDCTVPGGLDPTTEEPGSGISHFATCRDANRWRKANTVPIALPGDLRSVVKLLNDALTFRCPSGAVTRIVAARDYLMRQGGA